MMLPLSNDALYSGLVSEQTTPSTRTRTGWKMLLVLPYLALMFPQVYARATPELFGFPFFIGISFCG